MDGAGESEDAEVLPPAGFAGMAAADAARLLGRASTGSISGIALEQAIAASTESVRATIDGFRALYAEYTDSSGRRHKAFSESLGQTLTMLDGWAKRPDLTTEERKEIAGLVRTALEHNRKAFASESRANAESFGIVVSALKWLGIASLCLLCFPVVVIVGVGWLIRESRRTSR